MKKGNARPNRLIRFIRKVRWFFTVYLRPAHDATVNTLNGLMTFDSKDRTIGRELFVRRHFEYDMMQAFMERLRQLRRIDTFGEGAVLDVGGNIGMSSIALLRDELFSHGAVFEPHPNNFRLLKRNIDQNGLSNRLIPHNLALSDRNGEITLTLNPKNSGDHRVMSDPARYPGVIPGRRKTIQVNCRRLDDLLDQGIGIDPDFVRLIWMDIQGHEGQFFKGARTFLQTHRNIPVVIEFWPDGIVESGMTEEEFCQIVQNLFTHFCAFEQLWSTPLNTRDLPVYFKRRPEGSNLILINPTFSRWDCQ